MTIQPTTTSPGHRTDQLVKARAELWGRQAYPAQVRSQMPPCTVVVNDAPAGLRDRKVRSIVSELASLGGEVNMSVELRGDIPEPTVADLGGATYLHTAAFSPDFPHVFYRCLRPLRHYPEADLVAGKTRLVHADPTATALGAGSPDGPDGDSGVFAGWHLDHSWVRVTLQADTNAVFLLAGDLYVEVEPGLYVEVEPGRPTA